MQLLLLCLALYLLPAGPLAHAQSADVPRLSVEQALPRLREKGYLLMMRHGQTEPGVGDPPNFRLGDCATQRNLVALGREQSHRIGQQFSQQGLVLDVVRTSQWCRCIETARLAFGKAEEWAALNSTFQNRDQQNERNRQIIDYVSKLAPNQNVMLVTHQINISPFSGGWVDPAEIVAFVFAEGRLTPRFRITPPNVPAP